MDKTSIKIKKNVADKVDKARQKYNYSRDRLAGILINKGIDFVLKHGIDEFLKIMGGMNDDHKCGNKRAPRKT